MDAVSGLRALGFGARVSRIERCPMRLGGRRLYCGDLLCPKCAKRWRRRQQDRLRARLDAAGRVAMVFATVKASGVTPGDAAAKLAKRWGRILRWARSFGATVVAGRHLCRGARGLWLAHWHVIVAAPVDLATLVAEVTRAGSEKRSRQWVAPVDSIERALGYAVNRALEAPDRPADLDTWILATRRTRRTFATHPSHTYKRVAARVTHSSATPSATPATQARARVVALLAGSSPMAASALRRRLTPAHRSALAATLTAMEQAGELRRVAGRRGVRWALAEREAA